ncbi:MAG: urea ABC transporter permease subunit UrtC [Clostridiales bacterium]|nr:urea ABC transporter permease subunit UrtC [Clostridiales bacterium]
MKKINLKEVPVNRYIDLIMFVFLLIFPLLFSQFRVELMGKTMVYMLFAISLDLLWGYAGLMSMGHAVLFGIGGYVLGLSYTLKDGIPEYMQRVGMQEIPFFFKPLLNPEVAFILSIVLAGLVAFILGYFIFSSRINGVFFSLVTLALAEIFSTFISNQTNYTNGSNGLESLPRELFGYSLELNEMYYVVFAILLLIYAFCRWLMSSRFGKTLEGIRENEARLTFMGYNPTQFKIAAYVISGMIAGLAGALYIPMNNFISPSDIGVTLSTYVLVWVAIGGKGNLTGAMTGTLALYWLQILLSEKISDLWLMILGVLIIFVIFVIPKGFVGVLIDRQYQKKAQKIINERKEEEAV